MERSSARMHASAHLHHMQAMQDTLNILTGRQASEA